MVSCCKKRQQNFTPITNENHESVSQAAIEEEEICLKISFLWVGIGFLLPYNTVVTAVDFFQMLYGKSIDFYLGWFLLIPTLLILSITLKFNLPGTIYKQLLFSFFSFIVLTAIIPLVDSQIVLFTCSFLVGIGTAILQASMFCLLGFLGPDMMSITQTGLGVSGIIVGLARIITKIVLNNNIRFATYIYFLLAIVGVIIDIILIIFVIFPSHRVKLALYKHELSLQNKRDYHNQNNKHEIEIGARDRPKRIMVPQNNNSHQLKQLMANHSRTLSELIETDITKKLKNNTNTHHYGSTQGEQNQIHEPFSLLQLYLSNWQCSTAVFFNYLVTLALFPGVISLMTWDVASNSWFAILQIFLFNLVDTIGKRCTAYETLLMSWNINVLLLVSVLRFALIPLFVLCVKPLIFSWPYAILFNLIMSFSNGFVGTSAFCLAPLSPNVPQHEKGRVSQLTAFTLTCGLVCGVSLALLLSFLIDNYL